MDWMALDGSELAPSHLQSLRLNWRLSFESRKSFESRRSYWSFRSCVPPQMTPPRASLQPPHLITHFYGQPLGDSVKSMMATDFISVHSICGSSSITWSSVLAKYLSSILNRSNQFHSNVPSSLFQLWIVSLIQISLNPMIFGMIK